MGGGPWQVLDFRSFLKQASVALLPKLLSRKRCVGRTEQHSLMSLSKPLPICTGTSGLPVEAAKEDQCPSAEAVLLTPRTIERDV